MKVSNRAIFIVSRIIGFTCVAAVLLAWTDGRGGPWVIALLIVAAVAFWNAVLYNTDEGR